MQSGQDESRKSQQRADWQIRWKERTPSNEEIAIAFSNYENLKLFCVLNTAKDALFVSASSDLAALIICKMNGHIESINNGKFFGNFSRSWKWSNSFLISAQKAVDAGYLGVIHISGDYAVTREGIFGPDVKD